MTFQNMLTLISKWNSTTIEDEQKRIVEQSGCTYLEELIVCVHIIHLKVMTHIRVGNRQKKIDISLPKLGDFIHKVYINCARQIYKNVYLFERQLAPLVQQKYNRELELIIQQAILTTVRDSIPKEQIIRSFLDENMEVEEEIILEPAVPPPSKSSPLQSESEPLQLLPSQTEPLQSLPSTKNEEEEQPKLVVPSIENLNDEKVVTQIKFNDVVDFEPSHSEENELSIADLGLSEMKLTEIEPTASNDAIALLDIQEI